MSTGYCAVLVHRRACDVLLSPRSHFTDEETGATTGRDLARGRKSLNPGRTGDKFVRSTCRELETPSGRFPRESLASPSQALAGNARKTAPPRRFRVCAFRPRSGPGNTEKANAVGPCLQWESFSNLQKAFLLFSTLISSGSPGSPAWALLAC